jgi:hypothetical protein
MEQRARRIDHATQLGGRSPVNTFHYTFDEEFERCVIAVGAQTVEFGGNGLA